MRRFQLSESGERGWFIGAFDRAIWKTAEFEVAYMFNPKGDVSDRHYHKIAREISLIASGHVVANGEHFRAGELFEIAPGEELTCEYLEDTVTVCVKTPSVLDDKYYI